MKITYETVREAADDIDGSSKTIHQQLTDLDTRVKNVVETWSGQAQEAFNAKHKNWGRDVQGLTETLQAIARELRAAADGYQHTDRKAAQYFQF